MVPTVMVLRHDRRIKVLIVGEQEQEGLSLSWRQRLQRGRRCAPPSRTAVRTLACALDRQWVSLRYGPHFPDHPCLHSRGANGVRGGRRIQTRARRGRRTADLLIMTKKKGKRDQATGRGRTYCDRTCGRRVLTRSGNSLGFRAPCARTRRCRCVGLRVVRRARRRLRRYRTADDGHYKDTRGSVDGEIIVLMGRTGICDVSSCHRGRRQTGRFCRPELLPLLRTPNHLLVDFLPFLARHQQAHQGSLDTPHNPFTPLSKDLVGHLSCCRGFSLSGRGAS